MSGGCSAVTWRARCITRVKSACTPFVSGPLKMGLCADPARSMVHTPLEGLYRPGVIFLVPSMYTRSTTKDDEGREGVKQAGN